jgi:hypothetical protein
MDGASPQKAGALAPCMLGNLLSNVQLLVNKLLVLHKKRNDALTFLSRAKWKIPRTTSGNANIERSDCTH